MSLSVYRFTVGDVYHWEWLGPVWPRVLTVTHVDRINKIVYLK